MSAIKDGGPAFPMAGNTSNWDAEKGQFVQQYGMTLRDWFAGQALAGMCALGVPLHLSRIDVAQNCYDYADAMLKAREVNHD